jgi:hypothetical protein
MLLAGPLRAGLPAGSYLSVTEENDLFAHPYGKHQDRHYTQGLRIVAMAGPQYFTNSNAALDRWLPTWSFHTTAAQLGLIVLGQNIYTPSDILTDKPLPDDRPYAGWLYTGLVFQRHGITTADTPVLENWEINLGVIGPESLADEAQSSVHQYQDPTYIPLGWGNQLKTEFGLELKYGRYWRLTPRPAMTRYVDFVPHVGVSLGNVRTHLQAGGLVRVGWNLPADFGPQLIDSPASDHSGMTHEPAPFSCFLFTGATGRLVVHNIFLDGNTFTDSMRADKEWYVGDWVWGFGVQAFRHVEFTYTRVRRSHEFKTQQDMDVFGSLFLRLSFDF